MISWVLVLVLVLVLVVPLPWVRLVNPPIGRVRVGDPALPPRRVAVPAEVGARDVPELAVGEGLAGGVPRSPTLRLAHGRFLNPGQTNLSFKGLGVRWVEERRVTDGAEAGATRMSDCGVQKSGGGASRLCWSPRQRMSF